MTAEKMKTITSEDEVKPCLVTINDIILRAKIAANVYCYLRVGNPLGMIENFIFDNEFLVYIGNLNLRTAILELSKLFPDKDTKAFNHHYSFKKVIREIKELKLVSDEKFKNLDRFLFEIENVPFDGTYGISGFPDYEVKPTKTKVLQTLRDKYIAHTDSDRTDIKFLKYTIISVRLLQEITIDAEYALRELNDMFGDLEITYAVSDTIVKNLSSILEQLVTSKKT